MVQLVIYAMRGLNSRFRNAFSEAMGHFLRANQIPCQKRMRTVAKLYHLPGLETHQFAARRETMFSHEATTYPNQELKFWMTQPV
jgi:hypothetical protein